MKSVGPEREDDPSATARKQLRLLVARGELAEARAKRMMRSCANEASALVETGDDRSLLQRHAWRTSTLLEGERMLQSSLPAEVDLGETFTRYATHFLIGSETMEELHTSAGLVLVGGEVCRWVMLVATELLHAVEASADPNFACKASVYIDHREEGLVMSVIARDGCRRPVPRRSGTEALARAGRLMELFGELVTSVRGSDVVYEATFLGGRCGVGS